MGSIMINASSFSPRAPNQPTSIKPSKSTTGNCASLAPSSPSYLGNGNCHLRRFPFPVHDVVEEGSEEKKKEGREQEEEEAQLVLAADRPRPPRPSVHPASDLKSSKPNKREVSSGTVVDAAPPDLMGLSWQKSRKE